jgi:hypothetical protein
MALAFYSSLIATMVHFSLDNESARLLASDSPDVSAANGSTGKG